MPSLSHPAGAQQVHPDTIKLTLRRRREALRRAAAAADAEQLPRVLLQARGSQQLWCRCTTGAQEGGKHEEGRRIGCTEL